MTSIIFSISTICFDSNASLDQNSFGSLSKARFGAKKKTRVWEIKNKSKRKPLSFCSDGKACRWKHKQAFCLFVLEACFHGDNIKVLHLWLLKNRKES